MRQVRMLEAELESAREEARIEKLATDAHLFFNRR